MFNDVLDTDINIPEDMIDRYYASELKLEQSYLDDARKQQIEDAERADEEYTDNYLFDEAENEGISNYNVNQPTEIKPNENLTPKANTDDLIINEKLSPELMEEINTLVAYIKSKLYDVALAEKDIDSADLLKKAIGAKNIEEVNKIYKEILDNIC